MFAPVRLSPKRRLTGSLYYSSQSCLMMQFSYDRSETRLTFERFVRLYLAGLQSQESRPELESVGIDRFAWCRSRSWSRQNFADSDSGPESQDSNRQQTVILAERLCIVPKTLKTGRNREGQRGDKVEAVFSDRISSVKGYRR